MRLYLLLFLLLVPCALGVTLTNGSIYKIGDIPYTVLLVGEDVILLEYNGTRDITHVEQCFTYVVTRTCLTSATETQAVFEEEFIGADLDIDHDLSETTIAMGSRVTGTVELENEGEVTAREAEVKIKLPAGVELVTSSSDKQNFTWRGTVKNSASIDYRVIPVKNGTFSWNGTGTYFDGNRTVEFSLPRVTLTATIPFTYTLAYDNKTTNELTSFNMTLTRKSANDNLTYTITAVFPPETEFNSTTRNVKIEDNVLTYRKTPNSSITKLTIDVLYRFTAPPSAPLNVTVTYKDGGELSVSELYWYEAFGETEPALAVAVDPLFTGEQGAVTVTIPGNHTGTLSISGPLLKETVEFNATSHTFTLSGNETGNYTHTITFTTKSVYGTTQVASGEVQVEVQPPPEPVVIEEPVVAEPEPEPVVVEEEPTAWVLYVGIAAALVLLVVLFATIHALSDPIRRIEKLTARAAGLRTALTKKKKTGKATPQEEEELAQLEAELDDLSRSL